MTTFASDGTTTSKPKKKAAPPVVVEPDGTPVDNPPSVAELATGDEWPHDWLEFKGDKLEIRVPRKSTLAAVGNAINAAVPPVEQNAFLAKFLVKHMSSESRQHVFNRMIDPDDDGYANDDALAELVGAILNTAADRE